MGSRRAKEGSICPFNLKRGSTQAMDDGLSGTNDRQYVKGCISNKEKRDDQAPNDVGRKPDDWRELLATRLRRQ